MDRQFVVLFRVLNFLSLFLAASSATYSHGTTETSFDIAENDCNGNGNALARLGDDKEMTAAIKYVYANDLNDFWIGMKWNATVNSYQWLDGKLLGVANWAEHEPKYNGDGYCVYVDTSSLKWYTSLCTGTKKTICMNSESQFFNMNADKNFSSASLACTGNNKNLPVFMHNTEFQLFQTYVQSLPNTIQVWLGLVASGDYFQWLNGVPLSKYFWEEKSGEENTGFYVHAHMRKDNENPSTLNLLQIHAPDNLEDNANKRRTSLCQTKNTSSQAPEDHLWVHYHYRIKSSSATMYIAPRNIILVSRKTQCAVECSKDIGCYQYTLQDKVCKTYGKALFTTTSGAVVRLYERIEVNTKL